MFDLGRTIVGVADVVLALAGLDGVEERTELLPSVRHRALLGVAHPVFDLGEGLLDRIEVRRVPGYAPGPGRWPATGDFYFGAIGEFSSGTDTAQGRTAFF